MWQNNQPSLAGDSKVVPKKKEVASVSCQVIANDAYIGGSNSAGLNARISALVVSDPAHMNAVITQGLALPLGEIVDSLIHQDFCLDYLVLGNLDPKVPAEKMLQHPGLMGIMSAPLGGFTSDNIQEGVIDPRWEAGLLAAPVVALSRVEHM